MAGQKLYTPLTVRGGWKEPYPARAGLEGRVRGKKHETSCPQSEMLLKLKAKGA